MSKSPHSRIIEILRGMSRLGRFCTMARLGRQRPVMQAIVSWRANTFYAKPTRNESRNRRAVASDAWVAPTLDWLCVPTGRNDQLIHVALARGTITGVNGSIELVYWYSLHPPANREVAPRLSAREPDMAAQRAFDEAHRGQRPHRLHSDANCQIGCLGLMSMPMSMDQCSQPPGPSCMSGRRPARAPRLK